MSTGRSVKMPDRVSTSSDTNPSNTSDGRSLKLSSTIERPASDINPWKSPACRAVVPEVSGSGVTNGLGGVPKMSDVIDSRCARVISSNAVIPGTAFTIAFRTCSVRWLTGKNSIPPSSVKTNGRSSDFTRE